MAAKGRKASSGLGKASSGLGNAPSGLGKAPSAGSGTDSRMVGPRVEKDSLGEVRVPSWGYWGAQAQRAVENFPVSGQRLPKRFIRAYGLVKLAACRANVAVGDLDRRRGQAIGKAAREVIDGKWDDHFVVDAYQAGAGTSQNMNTNEVIANRANELLGGTRGGYEHVHPNDHVNMAQSTNDTFHVAAHVAVAEALTHDTLPALEALRDALWEKARAFDDVVKSGRTHLQDAVPVTVGEEFSGYAEQAGRAVERATAARDLLLEIGLGGTAVGSGLNAHREYARNAIRFLSRETGLPLRPADNYFEFTAASDSLVAASGHLRTVAVSLTKIANDFRLLSSGPITGMGELLLPAVQPGSSIMPGKVNPVMAEMLNMVGYRVMGNDAAVAAAGAAGQFELNVMMPMIAHAMLESCTLLAGGVGAFTLRCVKGIKLDEARCRDHADRNPILATALNPVTGYDKAAELAKRAYREGKTIREIVEADGSVDLKKAQRLLDPRHMAYPHGEGRNPAGGRVLANGRKGKRRSR